MSRAARLDGHLLALREVEDREEALQIRRRSGPDRHVAGRGGSTRIELTRGEAEERLSIRREVEVRVVRGTDSPRGRCCPRAAPCRRRRRRARRTWRPAPRAACGSSSAANAFRPQSGSKSSPSSRGRQRAGAPASERVQRLLELAAVLGQLVDGRGCGRRELPLLHDPAGLEVAQARGEDVRARLRACPRVRSV